MLQLCFKCACSRKVVLLHGSQYCNPSEPRVFIRTSKCQKLHSPATVVIDSCSAKSKKPALVGQTACKWQCVCISTPAKQGGEVSKESACRKHRTQQRGHSQLSVPCFAENWDMTPVSGSQWDLLTFLCRLRWVYINRIILISYFKCVACDRPKLLLTIMHTRILIEDGMFIVYRNCQY